jgi:hypothetical protein
MRLVHYTALRTFEYPYGVLSSDTSKQHLIEDVEKWAEDVDIDCIVCPYTSYFKNEQDALIFILKWS